MKSRMNRFKQGMLAGILVISLFGCGQEQVSLEGYVKETGNLSTVESESAGANAEQTENAEYSFFPKSVEVIEDYEAYGLPKIELQGAEYYIVGTQGGMAKIPANKQEFWDLASPEYTQESEINRTEGAIPGLEVPEKFDFNSLNTMEQDFKTDILVQYKSEDKKVSVNLDNGVITRIYCDYYGVDGYQGYYPVEVCYDGDGNITSRIDWYVHKAEMEGELWFLENYYEYKYWDVDTSKLLEKSFTAGKTYHCSTSNAETVCYNRSTAYTLQDNRWTEDVLSSWYSMNCSWGDYVSVGYDEENNLVGLQYNIIADDDYFKEEVCYFDIQTGKWYKEVMDVESYIQSEKTYRDLLFDLYLEDASAFWHGDMTGDKKHEVLLCFPCTVYGEEALSVEIYTAREGKAALLYQETFTHVHSFAQTMYLYPNQDQYYIMRYSPDNWTGSLDYNMDVLELKAEGGWNIVMQDSLDIDYIDTATEEEKKKLEKFEERAEDYIEDSICVIGTESNDPFVTGLYDEIMDFNSAELLVKVAEWREEQKNNWERYAKILRAYELPAKNDMESWSAQNYIALYQGFMGLDTASGDYILGMQEVQQALADYVFWTEDEKAGLKGTVMGQYRAPVAFNGTISNISFDLGEDGNLWVYVDWSDGISQYIRMTNEEIPKIIDYASY